MSRSRVVALLLAFAMMASVSFGGAGAALGSRRVVRVLRTPVARNHLPSPRVGVAARSLHAAAVGGANVPGVPLPASPVTGSLEPTAHVDDVYSIGLFKGQSIDMTLTRDPGTTFDLYLYLPGTTDVYSEPPTASVFASTYPEAISFTAGEGGTYYVDVNAPRGGPGAYNLEWAVRDGAPSDDNLPGLALPASPVNGALDQDADYDDVFHFDLSEGEEFKITMTTTGFAAGNDPWLLLYPPGSFDLEYYPDVASSKRATGPQSFTFVVPPGGAGTYYLDVYDLPDAGSGAYTLTWSIDSNKVVRFFGDSRYGTNQAVSRSSFATASTAILATGGNFADALSASGLAGAYDAPIILTRQSTLSDEVRTELWRLGVTDVIIVGGTSAVSADIETSLTVGLGYDVRRVAGASRYDTAKRVAEKLREKTGATPEVFVVRGDRFPDALAVAPFAYHANMPILLTKPTELVDQAESYITSAGVTGVFIAGGPLAVSGEVENVIDALPGVDATRVAGTDRYSTARVVADFGVGRGWGGYEFVGVATGANFPDALSGGAACGMRGGALLLTETNVLSSPCAEAITGHAADVERIAVFGGPPAVSPSVMTSIESLVP
jgi:putative cell wall-binding protein